MPPVPRPDDDWSDSDEEDLTQVETSVLLGVPDSNIDVEADRIDAAVSRIGGLPVRASLVIVRAWRGLRINEKYAEKLARKRQRQLERERAKAKADEERARHEAQQKTFAGNNPFSMGGKGAINTPVFGLGAQIFGTPTSAVEGQVGELKPQEKQESQCLTKMTTMISPTRVLRMKSSLLRWRRLGRVPSATAKAASPKGVHVEDLGDEDKKDKDISWAKETYEDSLEVDQVFEKFMKRVGTKASNVYELKGTPLPFASDKTFDYSGLHRVKIHCL
ncbi:hypothetical protein BDZ97DRAFT_2070540 [Flammula alnicola]|nr:hypothetical protein BDZ97DRAFT_2070540 [Flammula alnicola]